MQTAVISWNPNWFRGTWAHSVFFFLSFKFDLHACVSTFRYSETFPNSLRIIYSELDLPYPNAAAESRLSPAIQHADSEDAPPVVTDESTDQSSAVALLMKKSTTGASKNHKSLLLEPPSSNRSSTLPVINKSGTKSQTALTLPVTQRTYKSATSQETTVETVPLNQLQPNDQTEWSAALAQQFVEQYRPEDKAAKDAAKSESEPRKSKKRSHESSNKSTSKSSTASTAPRPSVGSTKSMLRLVQKVHEPDNLSHFSRALANPRSMLQVNFFRTVSLILLFFIF
jgi:hypothetical protein